MKIIPKYASGGYSQFFNIHKSSIVIDPSQQQQATRGSSKEESKKDELGLKEIYDHLLKAKGMPNETRALFNKAKQAIQMANDLGGDGIQDIASILFEIDSQLPELEFNMKQFDNAYQRAVSNESLNDVAITASGHVAVQNEKGEIKYITPKEFVENRSQYSPVTNSNLLYLRSHSQAFIDRNDVYQTIENGIGLNKVDQMIRDRINNLGKTSESYDQFWNQAKLSQSAEEGLKLLKQAVEMGPEGYYKIHNESSSNMQAINSALSYILSTLPNNAKVRLALETKNATPEEVTGIISSLLFGKLDVSSKQNASYVGVKGGKGENGQDIGGVGDNLNLSAAERWSNGEGYSQPFTINFGDNNYTTVQGNTMPLTGKSDKAVLAVGSTLDKATESSYGGILDFNNMSIGGRPLSSLSSSQVVVRDNKITMIDFPCIKDRGKIVPIIDKDLRKKKDDAEKEIRAKGINLDSKQDRQNNYEEINEIYQRYELPPRYNSNGELNTDAWATFGLVNVAIDGDMASTIPDYKTIMQKADKKNAQAVVSILEQNNKGVKFDDDVYEGIIWIPVTKSSSAAMATSNVKPAQSQHMIQNDQARQVQQQAVLGRQLAN